MKIKRITTVFIASICAVALFGCGGPSGRFYRYNVIQKTLEDDDYFEFSGGKLTYHDRDNVYKCDYDVNGEYIEIKLNYPGNPLDEIFEYNESEGTLSTKYDTFKKR